MDRKNFAFLIVGILFGCVAGLFLSYAIFFQEDTTFSEKKNHPARMSGMEQPLEHMDIFEEIESLKKLLEEDSSNYSALIRLGNLYFNAVKFDRAMEYYSKALEIDDNDPNVITDLGICYRNTGDPAKAIEYFEKAYRKDPSHWQALFNIIIVATNDLLDCNMAENALNKLERVKPDAQGLDFFRHQIEELKKQKAETSSSSSSSPSSS